MKTEEAASRDECAHPRSDYYMEGTLGSCTALMTRGRGWNRSSVTSCVTITKLVNLSVAHFSPLENGVDNKNGATS